MNDTWAIVLAAGESKRMGVPKMLLPFDGLTMIERVIRNILESGLSNILVVLGSYREEIIASIGSLPVKTCYNENYKGGMLISVQCGFDNLPSRHGAVFVFPGDQPFIEPGVIKKMLDAFKSSGKGIIIPVYRKKRGHPLLVSPKYRNLIAKLPKDEGLHVLLRMKKSDIHEVSISSPGILKDIDTKEDYLNEINK